MTDDFPPNIIKVNPPKRKDILMIRILICAGLASMIVFLWWFIDYGHIGLAVLYWSLAFALFFKLGKMAHEWYHYWSPSIPVKPEMKTKWTVDILTTSCPGEPREMIMRTLKAMTEITYPHTNYLCDEGNDPILKKFCEENGIIHVTRKEKTNAKAGNINNALKNATGDICVILDPDHIPVPEFLDRTLPYFEDEKIGYVQCVQGYSNQDESIIARGAAEQTYHFYGPMMMCMNSYGTVQAIGANCTFRRKALDSIGGHAPGLAEDMHTAMQLHAKGWISIYIPEILTKGLVPATLSSYYKQQLKWTRGVFELFFRVYPSLFKKFTWRQKLHYASVPIYFFFGIINLIDITVPILSLAFAQVAWEIDVTHFALYFFPLFFFGMAIRLFAQRWLLEKHERGFQVAGGFLYAATWWIFLVGFVYAVLNINVPYIPTPKEDEHRNYWKLCLPNIGSLFICILAIHYGLQVDWTPYSITMAAYALINVIILGFITLAAQQKLIESINKKLTEIKLTNTTLATFRIVAQKTNRLAYNVVKKGHVFFLSAIPLVLVNYHLFKSQNLENKTDPPQDTYFYYGISLNEKNKNIVVPAKAENILSENFDVVSFKTGWTAKNKWLPQNLVNNCKKNDLIPMIMWEPILNEDTSVSRALFKAVSYHYLDKYLTDYADVLRKYAEPVFINFAPGFDKTKCAPEDFVKAWKYIFIYFNDKGVSNVTWVWSPGHYPASEFYPGKKYVDWVGLNENTYSKSCTGSHSFSWLYKKCRSELTRYKKPVMITDFNAPQNSEQKEWVETALKDTEEEFPEIRSVIYEENSMRDVQMYFVPHTKLNTETFAGNFFKDKKSGTNGISNKKYSSPFVKGTHKNFRLEVKGEPFYIRGIAYNTGHDWRDGNLVLTRRQLQKDFKMIREMGANTIRRYGCDIYDKNVLDVAAENDLKVVMGFWFDPETDFYSDASKVEEYINEVEEKVLELKNHKAVLAWSLGNETWGLLKHHFPKPYLCKVRQHYVKMIELLAQRIHKIDKDHPVFTCMEHEESQLPAEIAAFHDGAPSIDVIGINSYYKGQISKLNSITQQFDSLRPYLVSEFGPSGYWNEHYNKLTGNNNNLLVEETETQKAEWYKTQWKDYVLAFKGCNIGGFAYCWRDRMEGSCTWFGITDYKGRTKPSYAGLKELWTGKKTFSLPAFDVNKHGSFASGTECRFDIVTGKNNKEDLKLEWYLHKDDYLDRVNDIEISDDNYSVKLKMPDDTLHYRLYLYISDKKGNVSTVSIPVKTEYKKAMICTKDGCRYNF